MERRPHWWIHQFLCDCSLLIALQLARTHTSLCCELTFWNEMHCRQLRYFIFFCFLAIVLGCFSALSDYWINSFFSLTSLTLKLSLSFAHGFLAHFVHMTLNELRGYAHTLKDSYRDVENSNCNEHQAHTHTQLLFILNMFAFLLDFPFFAIRFTCEIMTTERVWSEWMTIKIILSMMLIKSPCIAAAAEIATATATAARAIQTIIWQTCENVIIILHVEIHCAVRNEHKIYRHNRL